MKEYTNAKFLNDYFNTGYKQYMTTRWELCQERNKGPQADNMIVWMAEIDGKENAGWINYDFGNLIIEDMTNGNKYFNKIPVRQYAKKYPYRIVVQKIKHGNKYDYMVRGLYKFDEERSVDDNQHYYVKI